MKDRYCSHKLSVLSSDYLRDLVGKICDTYEDAKGINHVEGFNLPRQQEIHDIINRLIEELIIINDQQDKQTKIDDLEYLKKLIESL